MKYPTVVNPPPELDVLKIETLDAINAADRDGHPLVVISMADAKVRSMTEAQFDAAIGFGSLFEDQP